MRQEVTQMREGITTVQNLHLEQDRMTIKVDMLHESVTKIANQMEQQHLDFQSR